MDGRGMHSGTGVYTFRHCSDHVTSFIIHISPQLPLPHRDAADKNSISSAYAKENMETLRLDYVKIAKNHAAGCTVDRSASLVCSGSGPHWMMSQMVVPPQFDSKRFNVSKAEISQGALNTVEKILRKIRRFPQRTPSKQSSLA